MLMTLDRSSYAILILVLLSVVWGSSFILIKKALIAFDPITVGALRISISSIAFFPIVLHQFKDIPWKKWKYFAVVGLTGSGIPAFMYAIAQTQVDSSISGLLNSLSPIFALIIGVLFFKIVLTYSKVIGVLLGFLGAGVLFFSGGPSAAGGNMWYGLFIVIGTMCYGTSVNVVKHYFQETPSLIVSGVSFFLIGPPALLYLVFSDFKDDMVTHHHAWYSLGSVALLSLVGTVISTIIFFRLVQVSNAVFASSVAFTIPIVAIFWGVLDGEQVGWSHFVGMVLILIGVYFIRKDKN
jgi:drug/metabolite transporter (DMT)-like permease